MHITRNRIPDLPALILFIVCVFNSARASDISTNKAFVVNNGTGGTVNNLLPPSETNFFDVNKVHLTNAINQSGVIGGAGLPGISSTGPANTIIVYDANGNAVGTNVIAATLGGNAFPSNVFNSSNVYVSQTNFTGALAVTNGATVGGNLTNSPLTASSLVMSDANKALKSVANGTGILTNDGAGNLSFVASPTGGGGGGTFGIQFQSGPAPYTGTNLIDGMVPFNSVFPLVAGVSPNAVMICDSLSVGNGSGSGGFAGVSNYMMFVTNGNYYGLKFNTVNNQSVGGQQIGTVSTNYTSTIHTLAPAAGTNTFLMCWGGINDIATGQTAESTYLFLTNIWTKARADGYKVVAFTLFSTLNIFNGVAPVQGEGPAAELHRLNQMIRASATNWDYLVDVATFFPKPENQSIWYTDATHPTNYGQLWIAYNVSNVLCRPPHWQGLLKEQDYTGIYDFNNYNVSSAITHALVTNSSTFTQRFDQSGNTFLVTQNGGTAANSMTFIGVGNSTYTSPGATLAAEYVQLMQPSTAWAAGTFYHPHAAQIQVGSSDTFGLDFVLAGGTGSWNFYEGGAEAGSPAFSITNNHVSTTNIVIATNGFSSLNTNILTAAAATSWSGQLSTINAGFTNNYGTNCTININGSVGTFIFWHSGGAAASTACANPLFTNMLSTNGWSRTLPFNCGVQVLASSGQANVTVDFGQ